MRDVKMKVDDLIRIIQENRDEHVAIFEKAYDVYEARVREEFEKVVALLRTRKVHEVDIQAPYRLARPENHAEDYDVTLLMLRDETRKTITLPRHEYQQYVQDDWGWKQHFETTNAEYLGADA